MAEIDKALPNVKKTTVELPGEDDLTQAIEEQLQQDQDTPDNIEIIETDEGGAEISFDPSKVMMEGSENHFANLAEYLDDDVLGPLGALSTHFWAPRGPGKHFGVSETEILEEFNFWLWIPLK